MTRNVTQSEVTVATVQLVGKPDLLRGDHQEVVVPEGQVELEEQQDQAEQAEQAEQAVLEEQRDQVELEVNHQEEKAVKAEEAAMVTLLVLSTTASDLKQR
jgi:hypothetical protein